MTNENFISYWEKTLQDGKPKFLLKNWLRLFILLFFLDLLINKLIFGDTSLLDYIMSSNWNEVGSKLTIWVLGSLVASYLQFWSYNKKYEKLKSDN